MRQSKLISAESVCVTHPDLVADTISDAILQAYYEQDKDSHVACETMVTTDFVLVAGEIKSKATIDVESIIRDAVKNLGYTDPAQGFSYDTLEIVNKLHEQSADIDMGVTKENAEESGAGDQGFMIGYASSETENLMPLPIAMARALTDKLTEVRESGESEIILPDGKAQVVLDYNVQDSLDMPRLVSVLISNHHVDIPTQEVRAEIIQKVIIPVVAKFGYTLEDVVVLVNPTGRFVIGGPNGDTGLTGRKLAVENYGPACPIGGGASAGKDLSKVDRSAAYAARYVAKNIVASGLATECEVQISYAIGVAEPTSIYVDTKGTLSKVFCSSDEDLTKLVKEVFELRPYAIRTWINNAGVDFNQVRKIGAYGNDIFPWEQLDKVEEIKKHLGI